MEWLLLGALPFLCAVLNRVRGGGLGIAGASAYIAGAALAVLVLAATFDPIAAGAFLVAYLLGESFGWGKWIGAVPHWHDPNFTQADYLASPLYPRKDGKSNGVHWLANKIAPETKDFRAYGCVALVLRGALWWVLPLTALAVTGAIPWYVALVGTPVLAFAFPHVYSLAYRLTGGWYWTGGELAHGFLQGLVLALGFLLV
jgi:uncharacterized membrane protein